MKLLSKIKFTDEQKNALRAEGTVLVAAAAGSGKTAVLVERVIRRLSNPNGLSADRVLIVTFTNAAATELKAKISSELKKKLLEDPDSLHLKRQSLLIEEASICTIDSFCINLVRENFSSLGISSDFKIIDENSFKQEKNELLNDLIREKLNSKDPSFLKTLSDLRSGYDESALKTIIETLYQKSCSMPYQEKWLNDIAVLNDEAVLNFDKSKIKESLFSKFNILCSEAQNSVNLLIEFSKYDSVFANKYESALKNRLKYIEKLSELLKNMEWDACLQHVASYTNKQLKVSSSDDYKISNQIKISAEKIKTVNDEIKKDLEYSYEITIDILKNFNPILKNVINLVLDYKHKIDEYYFSKNKYSFDMIEHFALKLLSEHPDVMMSVNNRYDEILVDEYQDTNNLQDELFNLLSHKKKNLFMVGDVKQSIYGFRDANPDNFLMRKDNYPLYDTNNNPSKVILTGNFRSRKEICYFNNFLFSAFMTKSDTGMDYNSEEQLDPIGNFPDNKEATNVSINIVEAEIGKREAQSEAECIADYITETMEKPAFLDDGNKSLRKAKFSDFVLLMRSPKKRIADYVKVFEKRGIPINCPSEKFSEASEIKIALSLLKVIDNPNNDISMVALLTSPIFGFSEDELCEIRLENKKSSVYSNLLALKDNNKIKSFVDFLHEARRLSVTLSVDTLLLNLFTKTGFFDICNALENGDLKKANLYLLIENAKSYCSNRENSVLDFIRYIESDSNDSLAAAVTTSTNAVTVMSFHSSKGLQFPICIVCSLATKFNMQDTHDRCVCDSELGAAFKYYSEKYNSMLSPCSYKYISNSVKNRLYKEELRLLYVALTRAKEKLVLFTTVKDTEKYLEGITEKAKIASVSGMPFIKDSLFEAKNYSDWILMAALCHRDGVALRRSDDDFPAISYDCSFEVNLLEPTESCSVIDIDREYLQDDNVDFDDIFKFDYPYLSLNTVPAKTSVSDILKRNKNSDFAFSTRPAFLSETKLTPAEIGSANHKFMECCDYKLASENLDSEIERLIEWQFLTERQGEVIDKNAISEFFKSEVYDIIKNSEKVLKEYRFITKVNCSKLNSEIPEELNEFTLVQGIADCVAVCNDGLVLIDFKTDNSDNEEYFIDAYKEQLELYSSALEKTFELPVIKKIIYSFKMRKCIFV